MPDLDAAVLAERALQLVRAPLFTSGLLPEQLEAMAAAGREVAYARRTVVVPEGQRPGALYVALAGRLRALRGGEPVVDEPDPRALDNANTPEEYAAAMSTRRVTVQYFALLREQAGRATESLVTAARTPRELYAELAGRYPFTLDAAVLRVAINSEFGDWGASLADGDAIVFIPPVAGG